VSAISFEGVWLDLRWKVTLHTHTHTHSRRHTHARAHTHTHTHTHIMDTVSFTASWREKAGIVYWSWAAGDSGIDGVCLCTHLPI